MIDLVIPTIGRPSLARLLASLACARGARPARIIIVDDRSHRATPLALGDHDHDFYARITVIAGTAAGPAAARNIGWRASRAAWIAFVDDDVIVDDDWFAALRDDLLAVTDDVAASQGHVRVPLPTDRPPTDWEGNVAGLETARWITADCAYRRGELLAVGGFDERFPRAYREDADLALRVIARGKRIVVGRRRVTHPVRPAPWSIALRLQAGNADDALMRALHGSDWYERAGASRGAFREHAVVVTAAVATFAALASRRPTLARATAAVWALQSARFAWRRIAPGPRTAAEIARMLVTSFAIPFLAVYHRIVGELRLPQTLADGARAPRPAASAVLFDRDGTLIVDVPFNADPARVEPMPYARVALDRLRAAGVPTAVVSNQSGIALGRFDREDVDAINARVEALLGSLGPIFICPHDATQKCACRKPAPGLIEAAARALGVDARDCVVIGDIGADIEAARAAGARAILVATPVTRAEEIAAAPIVAADLAEAVDVVLRGAA